MSAAQFLPCNNLLGQFNNNVNETSNVQQEKTDPQQFNLLVQAFLLMKARNTAVESSIDEIRSSQPYLSAILNPILLGHQAIPIHLKILIDRLIEHLDAGDIQKALQETGWSFEDLKRGYILVVSPFSIPIG